MADLEKEFRASYETKIFTGLKLLEYRDKLLLATASPYEKIWDPYIGWTDGPNPSAEKKFVDAFPLRDKNKYLFITEHMDEFFGSRANAEQINKVYTNYLNETKKIDDNNTGQNVSPAVKSQKKEALEATIPNLISAAVAPPKPATTTATAAPKTKQQGYADQLVKVIPVYPDTFNNFPSPTEPWVSIQFRTKYSSNGAELDKDENWEEIAGGIKNLQNKFFSSMELDDNKGVKRVTLVLKDKYFTDLENIIMKSIFCTTLTNKISDEVRVQGNAQDPKEVRDLFTFVLNKASLINLRLKFGYSASKYIDPDRFIIGTNFGKDDDFSKRTTEFGDKPVLQTGWMYFQILGMQQVMGEDGLTVTVNAMSTTDNFLSKAKLVKKFAKITGTPKNIIGEMRKIFDDYNKKNNSSKVIIASFDDKDEVSQAPQHTSPIEITCGTEPKIDSKTGLPIEEFRTMRSFFDELCSLVPPLLINEKGELSPAADGSDTSGDRVAPYSYFVDENSENTTIYFRYENPDNFFKDESRRLRTYFWREYPKTVIKSLNISTVTDFAQMNSPIIEVVGGEAKKTIIVGNESYAVEDGKEANIGNKTVGGFVVDSNNFDFSFVADGGVAQVNNAKSSSFYSSIRAKFLKNISSNIFRGTIELDGDPFYLFDKQLEPFNYLIKVVIMRPSEATINYDGSNKEDVGKTSYLSGFYAITNIKHTINDSGYSTTLEVSRFPSLFNVEVSEPVVKKDLSGATGNAAL